MKRNGEKKIVQHIEPRIRVDIPGAKLGSTTKGKKKKKPLMDSLKRQFGEVLFVHTDILRIIYMPMHIIEFIYDIFPALKS